MTEQNPREEPLPSDHSSATLFDFQTMGERHFRALVENAPVGMFHVDVANGWIYRNQTLVDLVNLPAFEDLAEATLHGSWIHPDDLPRYTQMFRQHPTASEANEIEFRILRPDGTLIYALQRAVPELDSGGNIRSWTGSLIDISERRRLESLELQERDQMLYLTTALGSATSENFFETLVRALTQAVPADMAFVHEFVESPRPHLRVLCGLAYGEPYPPHDVPLTPAEVSSLTQTETGIVPHERADDAIRAVTSRAGMKQTVIRSIRYADGRLLGIVDVSHHAQLDVERTSQILELFSVRAAAELERQRNQQALATQRENLRWLNDLSVRIHDSTHVQGIGREAVASMAEHISAPLVSIYLFDDHPTKPLAMLASNWSDPRRQLRYPRVAAMYALLHAQQGVVIVSDGDHGTLGLPAAVKWDEQFGIVAVALLLLHHGGHDLGLVVLEYTEAGYIEQLDPEILRALAKMLSLALRNAQHFEDIEYRAAHDSLTGLFNRNELHAVFQQRVQTHRSAALMLLDLDRFKEVNDTLGHNTGDQVLRQVADRLAATLRERGALVCRLGGDEFAVLICDDSLDGARALALGHAVQISLQRPLVINGMKLDIDASVGVALFPLHGEDSHALLRSADVAMYAAKRQRAGVRLYDPQLDTHTPERLGLMADLSSGIRDGELRLFYQPKLDLQRRQVLSCEALVRWQHPQQGLLSPDRFIPLAEMSEAIHALTARVIDDACRQQQQWRSQGIDLTIAVNLSARNLLDDRIVEQVERMLIEYALPPNALELEITETALMQDPKRAALLLDRLAGLGVRVAGDDFGTGYSSLAYLRRLPLHALKIDRTFITDMLEKPQDMVIVQSIISLAHNLGLEVVAEGVETAEVLDCLGALGCEQAQGYYLSRPVPAEDMLAWWRAYADSPTPI